jgi:uncharacterized protein (UPF0335 family)
VSKLEIDLKLFPTEAPGWAVHLLSLTHTVVNLQVETLRRLEQLEKEVKMADHNIDEILADVSDESTQIDSLSTLTAGIKKQLDDITAGSLPPAVQAKVNALFDAVDANKAKVVSAINANTSAPAGDGSAPPAPPTAS